MRETAAANMSIERRGTELEPETECFRNTISHVTLANLETSVLGTQAMNWYSYPGGTIASSQRQTQEAWEQEALLKGHACLLHPSLPLSHPGGTIVP